VLELGTHAEFVPHDRFTIRSFAAEEFPNVVVDGDVGVVALLAKRTFWEKATILHAEYHRGRIENAAPRSIPGACNGSCGTGANTDAFVTEISQ
jgi:hypothetical protein